MLAGTLRRHAPLALLLFTVVVVVAMHPLRSDVDPAIQYVSQYGNDDWSWLFGLGLLCCAAGLLMLGARLREMGSAGRAPDLMWAAAALFGLVAVFPSDRRDETISGSSSLSGFIHGSAAIAAISALAVAAAIVLIGGSGASGSHANRFRQGGRAFGLLAGVLVVGIASTVLTPEAQGLRQRFLLVAIFGWLLFTARQTAARQGPGCGLAPAGPHDS